MPVGKLAAQAGHAFTETLYEAHDVDPALFRAYRGGSKSVLVARRLDELLTAEAKAREAGIPCSLFTDSGHVLPPHFDGSPVVTALGVGPCTKAQARPFLKRFPSLRPKERPPCACAEAMA